MEPPVHEERSDIEEVRTRLVGGRSMFSVSELFHENSKIIAAAPQLVLSAEATRVAPDGFKRYVHARQVALPPPRAVAGASLWDAITQRRSCRSHSGAGIAAGDIADLAFYALGSQDRAFRRCVPSAGGLYPLELYVGTGNVEGVRPGLYHYDSRAHALDVLAESDPLADFAAAVFIPEAVSDAAAVLMLTAVFGRSKIKYGERAYRFALLEAGHAMQNVSLTATALGLGACAVGGFVDDALNDLVDADGVEEAVLYGCIIGVPVGAGPVSSARRSSAVRKSPPTSI